MSDYKEPIFGEDTSPIGNIYSVKIKCHRCNGTGRITENIIQTCTLCRGRCVNSRNGIFCRGCMGRGTITIRRYVHCVSCKGTGRI